MSLLKSAIVTAGTLEVGFVTLIAGLMIGKLLGKIAARIVKEAELARGSKESLSEVLGAGVEYAIRGLTLLVLLEQFGLARLSISVLLVLAVLAGGLTVLSRVVLSVENVIAGVKVRKRLKASLGREVVLGSLKGELRSIGYGASVVKGNDEFRVPHKFVQNIWAKKNVKRVQED